MKHLLAALLFSLSSFYTIAHTANGAGIYLTKEVSTDAEINFFKGTWAEALAKAKKENKLIFLDAFASWCGPCKLMTKRTFKDERVAAFYNENFINYKMDMEKHEEGPRLSRKLEVRAYPTSFFLRSDESIAVQEMGFLKPIPFIKLGKQALAL